MKVLLILALLGAACALQFPIEYEYKYRGVLATGIPGIRAQVSATGIEALVRVQMKTRSQGIAQLEDIKVGSFNGDAGCVELREPVPIKYSSITKYQNELEKPFGVNFAEELGHVMTVPKDDIEFVTNIRKSIIGILRVEPILGNLESTSRDPIVKLEGPHESKVFSAEEETIFGRCECQYTVIKLPEDLAEEEKRDIEKYVKVDEQTSGTKSSKGKITKIGDGIWRMIKAINFDKCNDRVILMHAGVSNSSKVGYGQFESVQSRSSVSTYIIRGSYRNFRVDKAIVEGDVILNPYGFKLERLQAMTNQTLRLQSAKNIESPLRLPGSTRIVKTWRYEVASPFSPPEGHPKPWVNYYNKSDRFTPVPALGELLGYYEKKSELSQYKSKIVTVLREIVREFEKLPQVPNSKNINPTKVEGSVAASKIVIVNHMLRKMEVRDLEALYEEVSRERSVTGQKELMLLIDLMASSGAAPPMKVLLEKMQEGKISKARISSIFLTLTNNLVSPVIIPELMKYAMSVDVEREPVVASTVLINFATVAHRVCLSHDTFNYSVANDIYGKAVCRASPIIEEFLSHLISKAKSASEDWVKAIYIEAASNLGSSHVIKALKPFITGTSRLPIKVRMLSVYALNRRKMPATVREEVFDILMRIVDDLEEDSEVRQGSLAVLLSWQPDSAWWQRMARLTWREPSPAMAAFFTFTAEKMALATDPKLERQASMAAFVLPLMKPFSPSVRYSYNYIYSRYDPISKIATDGQFAILENLRSVIPAEIYASLRNSFGGFNFDIFEFVASTQGLEKPLYELIELISGPKSQRKEQPYSPRSSESRRRWDNRDEDEEIDSRTSKPMTNIYMRIFDHITAFFPINKETIKRVAGEDAERLVRELMRGVNVNVTKYFNPMDVSYFVPTEIGLPLIGSASLPTMNLGNAEVRLEVSGSSHSSSLKDLLRAKKVHLLFKSYYRFISKAIVSLKTLVPWDETIIEAEVESYKEVNLPVYGNLTYHHTAEIKNLTLNLAPHTKEEFPIIYANNIPITSIKPLRPFEKEPRMIVIGVKRERTPAMDVEEHAQMDVFGMRASLRYKSDKTYPFQRSNFLDYLRKPERFVKLMFSPTSKQWESYIRINPRESPSKNVSLSISYLTPEQSEVNEQLIRTRKEQRERRVSSIPDFSATDSSRKRLEKVEELSAGHQVRAINAQLFFNGSEFRKYEALLAFTRTSEESSSVKEYKTVLALLASRKEQEPKAYCLEIDTETPEVESLKGLSSNLGSEEMKEDIRGQLYHGRSCESKSIVSFKGQIKISEERKRNVQYELEHMCSYDRINPVVELQTPAIYDEARIDIEFREEDIPKPFKNFTYNVEKFLEGLVHPHAYYNKLDVKNPEGKLSIEAKRPLTSKYYSFYAQKPRENVIIEELPISDFLTKLVPFLGLNVHTNRHSEMVLSRKSPARNTCQITNDQIITFDGLKYNYEPLHCYTVVAEDTRSRSTFLLHTRKTSNGYPEIKINLPEQNTEVVVSREGAVINGKPMPDSKDKVVVKDDEGNTLMIITRRGANYAVQVIRYFDIAVSERRLSITPVTGKLRSELTGLCGDFDGTVKYDLRGPEQCLYNDNVELFKYAWAVPEGGECDTDSLEKEQEKVQEFQSHCSKGKKTSKLHSQLQLSSSSEESDECYEYVYPIEDKVRGNNVCISEEPVLRCAKHCRLVSKKIVERPSKCWELKRTPEEVKEALEKGFLKHKINEPAKFSKTIEFKAAKECLRKDL